MRDRHIHKTEKLIATLEKNQDIVLVSSLVLLEFAEVIKKRIMQVEQFIGVNDEAKKKIKDKNDEKFGQFMNKITMLAISGKVILIDPDWNVKKYFMDAFNIFKSNFGDLKESNYCFRCKQSAVPQYTPLHVGYWDILHAINAKEFSADEIISVDKGFNKLDEIDQFNSLKVTTL